VATHVGIAHSLDEALGEINAAYREFRINDMIYGPIELRWLPERIFTDYRERNLDRGQFKPKQLFSSEEAFQREYGI
jgi:hypothetical protein